MDKTKIIFKHYAMSLDDVQDYSQLVGSGLEMAKDNCDSVISDLDLAVKDGQDLVKALNGENMTDRVKPVTAILKDAEKAMAQVKKIMSDLDDMHKNYTKIFR